MNIRNELRKLAASTTGQININENQIDEVCQYLQMYQYCNFIPILLNCITSFGIIDDQDEVITTLQTFISENRSTSNNIADTSKTLNNIFRGLTNQHMTLIKIVVQYSPLVIMFKKYELHSQNGRRRFLELRDNLTTQFQLQERNNLVLNALIIIHTVCEPFCLKAQSLSQFLSRIQKLNNVDESLNQLDICYKNLQLINGWLSSDSSSLENAIIIMEYLYKTGTIYVFLKHLVGEKSYFEIRYYLEPHDSDSTDQDHESPPKKKTHQIMSMTDFADHKRQLTFCNVDVSDVAQKKIMLVQQLKLLKRLENLFSSLISLENQGHPQYQDQCIVYTIGDNSRALASILQSLKDTEVHVGDESREQFQIAKQNELKSVLDS
ncbi:unnamed protein product [Didymodactylos carnosus]|uniref:Uncharacterized protein n=1 Tax=Didymodactylos carnosus TaxID=1234261 RepID=A0A815REG6_9BILA|nr:unnamed protein product [Didymodactylos carnosus]CAF4342089.1 unnamed protein product [Didymodactylos carnosus]